MSDDNTVSWFGHSGDLGDIIYALPTIRAAGGGTLYLYHQQRKTRDAMTAAKAESLRSLLILQPYIADVVFCPDGRPPHAKDHDLNGFRHHGRRGRNLADMHLATHGLGPEHRDVRWLTVDRPEPASTVIFARSDRYHNNRFPWLRLYQAFGEHAGFVGTEAEHRNFCQSVGVLPLLSTSDLAAVARVIAGCQLFVGNQSCPAAIAEGLKHMMILEVHPHIANCCFDRPGRINGWDGHFDLDQVAGSLNLLQEA